MKCSAIVFDMDGLMIDTERVSYQAWKRAVADLGYTLHQDTYRNIVGKPIPVIEDTIHQVLGTGFPIQEARRLKQYYFEDYIAKYGMPLKSGLIELLNLIDEMQLAKAVASSTDKQTVIQRLTQAGLIDRFETIVGGDEVLRGKPAPDIFLEAAERLGVAPSQCIVLEDSEAGICSAYTAGMMPIMVPDLKEPVVEIKQIAFMVLSSLEEVASFLETHVHR